MPRTSLRFYVECAKRALPLDDALELGKLALAPSEVETLTLENAAGILKEIAFYSPEAVSGTQIGTERVVEVGAFEGAVDLRLYALSGPQRDEYEDKLTALFLERDDSPGVLVVTCPAVTIAGSVSPPTEVSTYDAPVAFTLDDTEWNEEKVFDKRHYTYLTLGLNLPALLLQHVYTIEEYVLAINHDLASDVPDEQVQITEDGDLEPPSA